MSIYEKVLNFIERPGPEDFEPLALEVFRHQFESVAPYRDFCLGAGVRPEQVRSVEDVPAVSTAAFKYVRLEDAPEADRARARTFFTSGTTAGRDRRGCHVVPRPEVYRKSALAHLRRMLFPDARPLRILALHPTADRMPESSLAQMISWCIEEFGLEPAACAAGRRGLDLAAAARFLAVAESARAAVCLLGTTAAFGALFENLERRGRSFALADGSRMMDTGGAKGQAVPLEAGAVCERAQRLLGIRPMLVINEYGMTELGSQLYDATALNSEAGGAPAAERVKIAPPWLRPTAVDPVTLKPLSRGEIGLLRFFDLANVGSVAAVLTEDYGTVAGERVRVLGRARTAQARGCALAMEQFGNPGPERTDGGEWANGRGT